jgi:hypothetical protein
MNRFVHLHGPKPYLVVISGQFLGQIRSVGIQNTPLGMLSGLIRPRYWDGRGPGRPPGSPNKMGRDLMTLVMQAAENVGYVIKNEKGEWVATAKGGILKYLEWAAVHKCSDS